MWRSIIVSARKAKAPRWETTEPLERFTVPAKRLICGSRKFDLIYKVRLADAWARGDRERIRRAETDYLEMQRARLSFFEDEPLRTSPKDFIDAFRKTARSLWERGYDRDAPPIPIETRTHELLNGAHRLACCAAYNLDCPVAVYPQVYFGTHGGSTFRAFRSGHIAPSVENRGVRAYLDYNECARVIETSAQPDEDEEAAIARVEHDTHGLVWHASRRGEKFVFVVSFPAGVPDGAGSRDASQARATELFPELPDPDWRARARELEPDRAALALKRLKYMLTLPVKFGRKRRKARLHILDLKCRAIAFEALADYLATSVPSKGFAEP